MTVKKFMTVLLMLAGWAICFADAPENVNLISNPQFAENMSGWKSDDSRAFSATEKVLAVKGLPELGDANGNLRLRQSLRIPKGTKADSKFVFGCTMKAVKVSGKFTVSVYEVNAAGKIIMRHSLRIRKRDKHNWKNFKREFTLSDQTKRLSVFIVAGFLEDDDRIELKDLYLYRIK